MLERYRRAAPGQRIEHREGVYSITRTRISLDSIVDGFREEYSPETILEDFEGLTLAHVYSASAFYLDHQADIDAYLFNARSNGPSWSAGTETDTEDARCAFFPDVQNRFCRNTTQQNEIIDELPKDIKEFKEASPDRRIQIKKEIRKTRIGGLLEFSRAVHAEMDALLSAGRQSISVEGAMLFVTTYPCHYCARHLITAGIDEVQYIEPYPKSQALRLHHDSIVIEVAEWKELARKGVKKVLFHPFSGVAPRLYERSFLKDRELKEKDTGIMRIHEPEWTSP